MRRGQIPDQITPVQTRSSSSSLLLATDHNRSNSSIHNKGRPPLSQRLLESTLVSSLQMSTSSKRKPIPNPVRLARIRSHQAYETLKNRKSFLSSSSERKISMVSRLLSPKLYDRRSRRSIRRHRESQTIFEQGRLGMLSRRKGRISSRRYSSEKSLLASFQSRRPIIRVQTMPFGVSSAPKTWVRILNQLIKHWREKGIQILF